ncbi:XRE family transcriptional regulator [Nocardia yunnanensis]|uniref:XRE family transcriptional regulator n=1 Tax=Nocardia yunnanensis TaxID=2382165 RepID=A0A386ZH26_9NOCA|nr:helix-turn-helix transcriptional regulator [Nocardia yunnanensis]AYF76424.1 XRE family transcriptional regulator [Nocardia yunnanensis]
MELGSILRSAREAAGIGLREMARRTHFAASYLSLIETGRRPVTVEVVTAYERTLGRDAIVGGVANDDGLATLEWMRRVSGSDIGSGNLERLEAAVDDLAAAYPTTRPDQLLAQVDQYLGLAARMMDGKKTLAEYRRLVVAVGWMSLLAGTCQIDLGLPLAAAGRLRLARAIGDEAGHPEIVGWCLETSAWSRLIARDYAAAVELSRAAQAVAPDTSSAHIQATAQEGRALARLGDRGGTYDALRRVARLVAGLRTPDRPEHHFRYDPAKSDSYVATTLAWLGDPAAETYARHVLTELVGSARTRPRRIATANIDLGLALVAADKPDEAADVTLTAVTSGRLVPSNFWRVTEVVTGIERRDPPDAAGIREALRDLYR